MTELKRDSTVLGEAELRRGERGPDTVAHDAPPPLDVTHGRRDARVHAALEASARRAVPNSYGRGRATPAALPLSVELGPGLVKRASYRFSAMARGTRVLGSHFVRYRSPAGFWVRQLELPAHDEVRVYPDVQAVRHYELMARQNRDLYASRLAKLRGGDTEFERLRDYQPDDDFRRIDWKATARRRKLTTREYQLEKNQNVVFMIDCGRLMTAVWDDLTALDYALNATLMLSHVAVRRGDLSRPVAGSISS